MTPTQEGDVGPAGGLVVPGSAKLGHAEVLVALGARGGLLGTQEGLPEPPR